MLPCTSISERTLVSEGVRGRGVRLSEDLESTLQGRNIPSTFKTVYAGKRVSLAVRMT